MGDRSSVRRRRLLRAGLLLAGAGVAGCTGQGDDDGDTPTPTPERTPTATPTPTPGGPEPPYFGFADHVSAWTWFPSEGASGGRSDDPFDVDGGEDRWHAGPTEGGGVRCLVEGDQAPGNAGIYLDIGRLGRIGRVDIDVETVRSDGDDQQLLVAIYLDRDGDGDYFEWEPSNGHEALVSLGDDVEAVRLIPAGGPVTVEVDHEHELVASDDTRVVTLGELQRDRIDGVTAFTDAAIQVSVVGSGEGNTEAAIVHDVEVTPATLPAEGWAMAEQDFSNTSVNRDSFGPTAAVEPRWTLQTDGPIRSSPAVVEGTVYVGSDDAKLYAIDAASGETEWTYETGGPVVSSPAVLGRTVYVGSDDGHLHAVSRDTGDRRWAYETHDRVRGPPTVEPDSGVAGADDLVAVGSDDGSVYALDAIDGTLLERIRSDGRVLGAPVVYYVGQDGSGEWNGTWEMAWMSTDGHEYEWVPNSPTDQELFTWDLGTPSRASMVTPRMNAAPGARTLHRYTSFEDGRLVKIGTGRTDHWTHETDGPLRASPALGSSTLVLGGVNGQLYGIDASEGERRWTVRIDGGVEASPSMADGLVYVGSQDGGVYALSVEEGDILWSYETDGAMETSPAVVEGTVYVTSTDGNVYALEEG